MGLAFAADLPARMLRTPAPSALKMVGMVFANVITPAAATAPAPMGLM